MVGVGISKGMVSLDDSYPVRMVSEKARQMLEIAEKKVLGLPAFAVLGGLVAGPSRLPTERIDV